MASASIAVAALFGYIALSYQEVDSTLVMADFLEMQPYGVAKFWKDAGYKGESMTLNIGGYTDVFVGDFMCNDCISSF